MLACSWIRAVAEARTQYDARSCMSMPEMLILRNPTEAATASRRPRSGNSESKDDLWTLT
ncbi:hypothetical protein HETIRDRAFT_331448 [Heterobasidion irregulare TC 32-1]|uniref:Uncharacterized protein n=1 Tax=Heterobasidion irregulare (strain TC 32-1) TaxID=747525 RepID=W4JP42_HETIT|nr:uncharacterized protein HETIRDRAFT_331448 [Heterobasidion irregulare TC 32-1]ETW75293.1 hypothetical protein HETIRDRAFT_331448 [Heterobasidion irregulare TC 32-1]